VALVLHIGPPKTATSYIQGCLIVARENPPAGFAVANAGWYWNGHHQIPRQLSEHRIDQSTVPNSEVVRGDHLGDLRHEIETSQDRDLVVSSETFTNLNRDEVGILREAIPEDVEVRIVVGVRPLLGYYLSGWRETLKRGLVVPFPHDRVLGPVHFLTNRTHGVLPLAEMKEWMDNWVDRFGRDVTRVFAVPRTGSAPILTWHRFLEAGQLSTDEGSLRIGERVHIRNESLDAWSTEVAMYAGTQSGLNAKVWLAESWGGLSRADCGAVFENVFNRIRRSVPEDVLAHDPNLLIDESQIATLVQALEPDVQRLRDYCSQFQFIGELDDLIDRIPAQTPEKLEDYRARTAEYPPEVYARWLVELVKRQALETVASIP